MGAPTGAGLPAALREAQQIVNNQLTQLRTLLEQTRVNVERLSIALRQAERQLDEATIQHRTALQIGTPNVRSLASRMASLRTQCEELSRDLEGNQRALKQLDQLVRQIAMSSDVLTGTANNDDPWVLALRAQVIHGREEERSRLAREVHDGPAQVLANSLMILESCYTLAEDGGDQQRLLLMLDRLRGSSREGLEEVRRFIADLRSGTVRERGLENAIREYARVYQSVYGTNVKLEVEQLPRFAEDIEIVLYRIVQEALQNVAKYVRGAPLTVRLLRREQQVILVIRDEGPGFDPHEVARRAGRSNWGLTSMRERAELIGARLTVASRPGQGTEVSVVMAID